MEKLPKIIIESIPHKEQRYETSGDYEVKDGVIAIKVSQIKPEYEFLVVLHELIEWFLITKRGISIESIDKFDMDFEKLRKEHPELIGDQECGNMLSAPYFAEHQFADFIERQVAQGIGVDWNTYEKDMARLYIK